MFADPQAWQAMLDRYRELVSGPLPVADAAALEEIRRTLASDPLSAIKKMIRCGSILFCVMKNKYRLQGAADEDFLVTLGLTFPGACR